MEDMSMTQTTTINNDEQFERNQAIIKRVAEGVPMATVAKEFGVTKQRIDQIFKRGRKKDPELIPLTQYCAENGTNKTAILKKIRENAIEFVKIGNKYYMKSTLKVTKICGNCGNPYIPDKNFRYCSVDCRDISLAEQHKKALWRRFNRLKKEKDKLVPPPVL
jgi:hypothetical protein